MSDVSRTHMDDVLSPVAVAMLCEGLTYHTPDPVRSLSNRPPNHIPEFHLSDLTAAVLRDAIHGPNAAALIHGISTEESEAARHLVNLMSQLGKLAPQARDGRVVDKIQAGKPGGRTLSYRSTRAMRLHCDPAPITGLLCVRQGLRGGTTTLMRSVNVLAELSLRNASTVATLFEPLEFRISQERGTKLRTCPARWDGDQLRFWLPTDHYPPAIWSKRDLDEERPRSVSEFLLAALDVEPIFSRRLEPGELLVFSNHHFTHSRTTFSDSEVNGRLLLRGWVA